MKLLFSILNSIEPKDRLGRNNAASVFLMGALPSVGGSAISFLLGIFFVWGLISLRLRRFEFRMTRSDRLLAWTFTIFAASVFVTAIIAENSLKGLPSLIWLLPFLSPWVIIPRLRASPNVNYLSYLVMGAGVGAIGGLVIGFVQAVGFGSRPEGGAGNAAIYAIMSLALAAAAGLNINHSDRWRRLLAVAGLTAGLLAMTLSLTRGVMAAAVPVFLLWLIFSSRRWRLLSGAMTAFGIAAVTSLTLYGAWDILAARITETTEEIRLVVANEHTSSIGERLRLWVAGLQVIAESPLWGHGIQNRMDKVMDVLAKDGLPVHQFTHVHNGFLNLAIDGGVVVLFAGLAVLAMPSFVAFRSKGDADYRRRLFLGIQIGAIYSLCGMTQILFKHDIMDSLFIFWSIVIASSIPSNDINNIIKLKQT